MQAEKYRLHTDNTPLTKLNWTLLFDVDFVYSM